jgi:iron(III) transport system ATP-binding protein
MTALHVRGLTRSFDTHQVLSGVDLDVPQSSLTVLLGPSGCGKTTLLRILAGFLDPDAGTVRFGDRVVVGEGISALPPQQRKVGYVPQEGALFPHLTVAANIAFGLPRRRRRSGHRVTEMLDLVELPAWLRDRYPHELSGGQQQRVALARALAPEPSVVLLDEPFSSLDAALRESTGLAVVRALHAADTTAVFVTHDQTEALSLADQVAVLRDGVVAQADDPVGLYERPADTDIARFIGGGSVLAASVLDGVARCVLGEIRVPGSPDRERVMLVVRPEQIHLEPAFDGTSDGTIARVASVSYYGHDAVVRLDLNPEAARVVARVDGSSTPEVGSSVRLRVAGPVAVFDESGA